MEYRPLRVFIEVVRQGSFTKAARALHSTQSTVSKSVQLLEEQIGARLLHRVGQKNLLTAIGEVVFRRGTTLLIERDDLLAEVADVQGIRQGVLRLGLPPIGSHILFAPVFAAYRRKFPAITVELVEHGSDRLEQALRTGEVDLAGLLLPVSKEFDFIEVQHEPLTVLLPRGHRLAGAKEIGIGELREDAFILFDDSFAIHHLIVAACRREKFEPSIVATSNQIDFVVELVGTGLGISFLPLSIARSRKRANVRCIPLRQQDAAWHMAMAWRKSGYLSHAALAWLKLAGGQEDADGTPSSPPTPHP
ncbi:LysR family transcriptional regulator [Sphingobium sufflavum]|uniref:LysR family transcriptional regulator n=1 Tax=Sphingobium sufflavum TaxID=1129547 RepID=UPI001F449620|nr:LysR family transcriptional regulator [Sphingobium sufflavum]MCE7796188.1 LysR family transcriptional regulator [Sphingobium sufflavum]